jgi:hypothetical protein
VQPWWVALIAPELREGGIGRLAAELAEALDELYLAVALLYAELPHEDTIPAEDAERRELAQLLGRAIRRPSRFWWGPRLHRSFRRRLRALFGVEVIPAGWPEKPPPGGS